ADQPAILSGDLSAYASQAPCTAAREGKDAAAATRAATRAYSGACGMKRIYRVATAYALSHDCRGTDPLGLDGAVVRHGYPAAQACAASVTATYKCGVSAAAAHTSHGLGHDPEAVIPLRRDPAAVRGCHHTARTALSARRAGCEGTTGAIAACSSDALQNDRGRVGASRGHRAAVHEADLTPAARIRWV